MARVGSGEMKEWKNEGVGKLGSGKIRGLEKERVGRGVGNRDKANGETN